MKAWPKATLCIAESSSELMVGLRDQNSESLDQESGLCHPDVRTGLELFVTLCADAGAVGHIPYRGVPGSVWVLCAGRSGAGAVGLCSVSNVPNNKEYILKNKRR